MKVRDLKKMKPHPEMHAGHVVRRGLRIKVPSWGTITLNRYIMTPANSQDSPFSQAMEQAGMQPAPGARQGISITLLP